MKRLAVLFGMALMLTGCAPWSGFGLLQRSQQAQWECSQEQAHHGNAGDPCTPMVA